MSVGVEDTEGGAGVVEGERGGSALFGWYARVCSCICYIILCMHY